MSCLEYDDRLLTTEDIIEYLRLDVQSTARDLDFVSPGWRGRVSKGRLDMGSGEYLEGQPDTCGCLMSQLDPKVVSTGRGSYCGGITAFGFEDNLISLIDINWEPDCDPGGEWEDFVTPLWIEEIDR